AFAGDLAQGVAAVGAAQEVLDRARGELATIARALDLLERVPARAQPRDDAHVGGGGGRPAAVVAGHEPLRDPAADGTRRDAGAGRHLTQRQLAGLAGAGVRGLSHERGRAAAFPWGAV